MCKKYCVLLSVIFYSLLYSVDATDTTIEAADTSGIEEAFVNEKFQFIQDIYSQSWGLVIGINKYKNVEPLTYAVNDAEAVRDMLIENYGFPDENITMITDEEATKENILDGFNEILEKAGEKDRVVVFYAGHGETYKLPNGGDMGYLIPVDGNVENLYRSSIPMKSVYDIADMSYAKHILYLVDACYGGLTLSTRGLKKDNTPAYIKKMTNERGRMVITAGGKDEQVIEKPEWGHSAFTRNLIKGLGEGLADENSDGIITGDELGGFIRNRVVVDVDGAHTPQKGRIGSEMGEFVFISETLSTEIDEAYPRDVQIANQEAKIERLKRELERKEQENKMKKVIIGNEYVNTDFVLGSSKGFRVVGSFASSNMQYETLNPYEGNLDDDMFGGMGAALADAMGVGGVTPPERLNGWQFAVEKRLGFFVAGVGLYETGYQTTGSASLASYTYSSKLRYMHLYSLYELAISSRMAVSAGVGYGVPMGGVVHCEGTGCPADSPGEISNVALEKEDMESQINLLVNSSFAIANRFAVRVFYQHGFSNVGEYFPVVIDDPSTPLCDGSDGPCNETGQDPNDESRGGFTGEAPSSFGVSLVLRF